MKLAVQGAMGRMGTRIIQLIAEDPDLTLEAAIEAPNHPKLGESYRDLFGSSQLQEGELKLVDRLAISVDVVIDFSTPEACERLLKGCLESGTPLVIGTTGWSTAQLEFIQEAATKIPIFLSANFSKAVFVLAALVAEAGRLIGNDADIEIIERHHRYKQDAPSGTALRLAEVLREVTTVEQLVYGRAGQVGVRTEHEVGIHAVRGGSHFGEHTVLFDLPGDSIELSHRALNRDGFARGSLDAAKFLYMKAPGLYTMKELLGMSS